MYGKEESADVTKTYYIFKDQNARALFLESQGITQEELDAEENTYNYLKGDPALQNIDLGIFEMGMNIFRDSTDKIITDTYGNVALTELDLSHADYLENVECLDWVPNLKTLNLNSTSETLKINNTINYAYYFNNPYLNYQDDNINETLQQYIKTLDLLVVNADNFATLRSSGLEMFAGNQKIKTLIVLDGKNKHTIESSNLFQSTTSEIKNVIIDDGIVEIKDGVFSSHSIEHVTLPATLKTIGSYTFAYNKLTNTGLGKLPSSLTSLSTYAFVNNPNLTQITLTSPKDLTGWPNGGTVDGKTVIYER